MTSDVSTGTACVDTGKQALFITGASGFLGMQLLNRIDPDDYAEITLLSRSDLNLPERLAAAGNTGVVRAAIQDVDRYASRLDANTIILHLAAITGKAEPDEYFHVNTAGTAGLVNAAVQAGIAGFLFVSSIAVSFRDRKGYHYAESKQQAEQKVRESGLQYTIVRPTIILGRDSPIWGSFAKLAGSSVIVLPGSGKTRVQPVYIDDVVMLLLGIVSSSRFSGETLDLGGPEVLTMDDFVRRIHSACKGGRARVVHLPLGLILGVLRTVERRFPALLPVSSGQFASFCNDGTAVANELPASLGIKMKTLDEMFESLVSQA